MENNIRKIAANSGIIAVNRAVDVLYNLGFAVFIARYFGQAGFGELSLLAAFFFFLACADNQWINPVLVREMCRQEGRRALVAGNGLILRLCVTMAVIGIFWLAVLGVKPDRELVMLSLSSSAALLIASLISSYGIIFQFSLKNGYFLGANICAKILGVFIMFAAAFCRAGIVAFYFASIIPGLIMFFLVRRYSRRIIAPDFRIDIPLVKVILKDTWPLALSVVFIFIYHRLDHIMLFGSKGAHELGLYSASVKLAEVFNIVPVALMSALLPSLSRNYSASAPDFRKTYALAIKYLLIFIVPVSFYACLFPKEILGVFYGNRYAPSSAAFCLLMAAEVFVFLGVANNAILIAANKQKIDPLLTGFSAAINVLLNLWLIPAAGFLGAAIASLAAYASGPVLGLFLRPVREYSVCMARNCFKPLLASVFTAAVCSGAGLNFLVSGLIMPCVYVSVLLLIKGIDKEDVGRLKAGLLLYPR